jgi:hypothetical protein
MSRGVVRDVRTALARKHRLAMLIGLVFGGFVPVAIYVTSHHQGFDWRSQAGAVASAGLLYSVQTVYATARQVFGQAVKAAGFVFMLEGVMVTTQVVWLGAVALGLLVVVNALSAGVNVAFGSSSSSSSK